MLNQLKNELRHRLRVMRAATKIKAVEVVGRESARLMAVAVNVGLSPRQVWPWDAKADASALVVKPWGLKDFLMLADAFAPPTESHSPTPAPPVTSISTAIKVDCSIIIPVWNQAEHTFQCLRSLLHEVDLERHEVIVVDNGSQDDTARMLQLFGRAQANLRVISNEANRGFVGACNQGAEAARGRHLVFLNNDTIVLPGWLEALAETVDGDPTVGAVGSMLIFPDGKLQEAGSIIWRDGTGHNYGRGFSPHDPRYGFARPVDYCSGASLLIRRELWDQLGGFDTRYAPAYYEDTDLCFGVRSLGFQVIYQAASRLYHLEGATAGTDPAGGYKRFQSVNRHKFVEKWREVLERDHQPSSAQGVEAAADHRTGWRTIVFDEKVPTPDQDSGSVRRMAILKMLARQGQTTFVSRYPVPAPRYELELKKMGIEVVPLSHFEDALRANHYDVAMLCFPAFASYLLPRVRRAAPHTKIIFDTVDVHFLRLERQHQLTGDPEAAHLAAWGRKIEPRLVRECDQTWCVTPSDAEALRNAVRDASPQHASAADIQIVPNIHDLHERGLPFEQRGGLMFIGGFGHPPNADAVHFWMREIWPLVHEALPGAKFSIVGSHAPEDVRAYESECVAVPGYVPNVDSLFHSCRVFVAPLRFGAGMKGKIGQALAYGLPIVTTSIGAEGMNLQAGRDVLIADDAHEFARAVVELYQNAARWQQMSDAGYEFIRSRFTPAVVEQSVREAIEKVLASTGKSRR